MAWGSWNQALGRLAKNSYQDSLNEKMTVYGQIAVSDARRWILRCSPSPVVEITQSDNTNAIIISSIALGMVAGLIVWVVRQVRRREKESVLSNNIASDSHSLESDGVLLENI